MSLYSMNPKNIINSSNFVKEPVEKVIDTINKSDKNKIVLTGPRCGGKSIVLRSYEKELINSDNPSIYVFMGPGLESYTKSEFEIKLSCELHLCSWIISYIEEYYNDLYELCFVEIRNEVRNKRKLLVRYINEGLFYDLDFPFKEFVPGDLLSRIIEKMKQVMNFDTITICLDRFDWRNVGNSNTFQKAVSFYFDLFDKVILTTDDNEVYNNINNRRDNLNANGYDVIDVDYGKDTYVTKKIISADLKYYAKNKSEMRGINNRQFIDLRYLLSEDKYNNLIQRCEGNFELLFATIRKLYAWDLDDENNISRIFDYFEESLEHKKAVDKLGYARVLHL